ncbi:MAG: hypothetical protein IPL91_11330 [Hyphomicrobium sp.]|nr:hypothetical protein [Hyphomicrobium sp.]
MMIFVVRPLWIALLTIPVVLGIGWVTAAADAAVGKSFRDSAQKNAIIVETIVGPDSGRRLRARELGCR